MKLEALSLSAFGPFTDRALTFNETGLHIIYGPNEAGKSSALRGLKALLYGIDERTPDNFLHANDKLRIQGYLRLTNGHELTFQRRKGRKNTLLSADGETLDERALAPFIRGVTWELFETLFGIDHQALVQGGEEILAQKGEVGQALFSAALGSHSLHTVLTELDDTAKQLFLPAGSKPLINMAIRSHRELKAEIKQCSLSSDAWHKHCRALASTTKALEKTQSELADQRNELNRWQRIQRSLPKLARRRELAKELEKLGDVVVLAEDFISRRQQTANALQTAQVLLDKAIPRLNGLQQQLEGLSANQQLLDQAETIEDLHTRLGSHRKALQDQPHLIAERQQLLTDAEALLKEIRADLELKDIEHLRPILARRHAITELGSKKLVLNNRVDQTESNLRETEKRLKIARKDCDAIPESGPTDGLCRAIAAARKQGELDASIQSLQSEHIALQADCAAELSRLTLWEGEPEAALALKLPERESIHRFEAEYDELGKQSLRLEDKQQQAVDALQAASQRIDEINLSGHVPTEMTLDNARSTRDQIWQLLRRQWLQGEDITAEAGDFFQGDGNLPDRFENQMAEADELSDRLRREAERVHALASLQAQHNSAQQEAKRITRQSAVVKADQAQLDTDWQALWMPCQITPHKPREMRAWLDKFETLRAQVQHLSMLQQQTRALRQTRGKHVQRLNRQLAELGRVSSSASELESLLLECEALIRQLDACQRQREALNKEIKGLEADVASFSEAHRSASEALVSWQSQWGDLMHSFGQRTETSPSEADDLMERVRTLFAKHKDAEKLQIRIKAIDKDASAFHLLAEKVVAAIAPELGRLSADDAVLRLNAMLSENRLKHTQQQQINEQLHQVKAEIEESKASINALTKHLDTLCIESKCETSDQLEEAECKSAEFMRIKSALAALDEEILETGEGASIAALKAETDGIDADSLPGRIQALKDKIKDELEPRRIELAQTRGREEKELELMDGSDRAALLADQAQATLASIRANAERYIEVKLAAKILRDQIERYRLENQGPLVKRASELFSGLTIRSFDRLVTDFNDKDEPVLAGVRPGGARVTVEGMSSGTRDQLYLALRLASLEKYMEASEPMPFIVDDILVDFDDARSLAALIALAELAEKTQVILFTHHSQVVAQSKQLKGPVTVQTLY